MENLFNYNWELCKLEKLTDFFSGLTYSPDNVQKDGTFVLRSSNVKDNAIISADNVYVRNEVANSEHVQVGDVIVVVRNGSRSLIGKHAPINREMPNTVIGAFMTGLRSPSPKFLNTLLDTQQFNVEIHKNLGATINQITTGEFKRMHFIVPTDEDEKEKIGSLFRQLDDIITLHQRKLDQLKELKKAYLQLMFVSMNTKNNKVPKLRFADFEGDWKQRKLGDFLEDFSKKSTIENEYIILSSTNNGMEIREGRVSGNSNLGYKIIDDGDLVLSPQNLWLGNININNIGQGLVSPSYKTFKIIDLNKEFLNPQLRTNKMLDQYKNASTQGASIVRRNLELDLFYQIRIFIPKNEEQKQIGLLFRKLNESISLHQSKLDSIKYLKKAYLQNMFI
ncbi:MAG: restriction endonuclease subunit S [Enterococcus faecalis]|uniref:restriction endonuclease subunit S n=1 Tax=Enterococcus faecalis TaxID=1351 RepID=UPI000C12A0F7|nr:restriction endonuclease subunit S [Enterococcus faecalis]MDU0982841.1 restriction endonuclease subunit S [Enterococcus faecalis]MDU1039604.1 restriction endonuclease subunit S [Enterococcus faecalis]MDU6172946.1 restriction endonuclease subunit S [Enterococcus faecalis]NMP42949.1 restriction endonuclease subunit S [Enterococcus faecalis]NSR06288.1 restriction endonuclease subunit S [Enterococcus faecalis]